MTQTIALTVEDRVAEASSDAVPVTGTSYEIAVTADSEWSAGTAYLRVYYAGYYYQQPVTLAASDGSLVGTATVPMPVGVPACDLGLWQSGLASTPARIALARSVLDDGDAIGTAFTGDLYDAWAEETSELLTDQTYDPASAKAQSGVAIAGLSATLLHKTGDETKSGTLYFDTAYPKMVSSGMESPVPVYALPTFGVISDTTGQVNNLVHTLGSESVGGVKTLTSEAHAMVGLNTTVTSSAKLMLTLSGLTSETGVVWMRVMSNTVIGDVRVSARASGVIGFAVYNQAGTTLNTITLSAAVNGTTLEIYARRTNTAPIMIQVLMASVQGGGKSVPANLTWVGTAQAVPEGATEVTL